MKNRELIAVKDEPDWARDKESGALININKSEIQNAREQKKRRLQQKKEEQNLKAKVDKLESDISDIKSLLSTIAERL